MSRQKSFPGGAIQIAVSFSLLFLLSGCGAMDKLKSSFWSDGDQFMETESSLAMNGLDAFNHGQYHVALKQFEELRDRFPFGQFGVMAELKSADCKYYMGQFPEAIALYEEFENHHPTNEAIPYVLFQIGMGYFKQMDTVDRDTTSAAKAKQHLTRLLKAFPESPYTEEAQARVTAANNLLAGHELYIATFYAKTGSHEQAQSRLEELLAKYGDTEVAPQATELLANLKAGNPPKRTLRSWLPIPSFTGTFSPYEWGFVPGQDAGQ